MAPRAIWTGSVSFGLVNVPVRLLSATESKDVHFHQFKAGTSKRIHNKRVAEGSGREVDYDDIEKGYELPSGKYVMVTADDLASVDPEQTKTIDIEDFVDLHEIDPIYFDKSYYLAPDRGTGADRAYALLREAMARSEKVAIGRFVLRTKQYLVCIRTMDRVLVLSTLFFADEIRDLKGLDLPAKPRFKPKELQIAGSLVNSLSTKWEPSRYHDTYRAAVLKMIKAKGAGKEIEAPEPEERTKVTDLMAALEASVAESRKKRTSSAKPRRTTRKKAA
jgi:DNA end-binding protein Ku